MASKVRFAGPVDRDRLSLTGERLLTSVGPFAEYRKTTTILACRMDRPFEVETLEGVMEAQPGDWLAVGVAGELYPIAADVFARSYEPAGHAVGLEPGQAWFSLEIGVPVDLLERISEDARDRVRAEVGHAVLRALDEAATDGP